MKAVFRKNIKLKSATAYLVFEKEQERRDIQNFLNGQEFEDEIINTRAKEYLRNLRVIDENGIPTKKGEIIKRTGKMFVREEGKYRVWFVENDSFLGTKILYFERIAPTPLKENEQIKSLDINFQEDNYFLPIKDNPFSPLKLVENKAIQAQLNDTKDSINFFWVWDDLEKSYYGFEGKINENEIKKHSINSDKDLKEFISKVFSDWDTRQNCLKVRFKDLISDNEKTNFTISYSSKAQLGFDNIQFSEVPIMPYDIGEARIWRSWLVNQEIETKYYMKYDFEELVKSINQKQGFSAYISQLGILDIVKYREEIYDKDRAKQSAAFWHLAAPQDFNPDILVRHSEKTIQYPVRQRVTIEQITQELKNNTNHPIHAIIYYDKYVSNTTQQKILRTFFDCFDCPTKILITDNSQNRSDFLQKNAQNTQQYFLNQVFSKDKPQHNRYFILCESKEKYTVWELPNSIDFIEFSDKHIHSTLSGLIKESISYNCVRKEMLKPELRAFIENKI